jgi:cobalt-precorrin-5B (C1)-methyltransferase
MWEESSEQVKPLRTGLTTGSCATACACACAITLLSDSQPEQVSITLPKGKNVDLNVHYQEPAQAKVKAKEKLPATAQAASSPSMTASTIKDAGDDPDVTHGARVFVNLRLISGNNIEFFAGKGVGTVTKAGMLLPVGEPAINPTPRQMISDNLQRIAAQYDYRGGFAVTIGIENGEAIAQKNHEPAFRHHGRSVGIGHQWYC